MKTQRKILNAVRDWQAGNITLADVKRIVLPYCHWNKFAEMIAPGSTSFEIRMAFESAR